MAWLKKRPDPISDRARTLNNEIAALEAQIKKLDQKLQRQQNEPREPTAAAPAETSKPLSWSVRADAPVERTPSRPSNRIEPIFEPVDIDRLKEPTEGQTTREHFNELGVRKYDLPGLIRRFKKQFEGPSTTNPKLVSYLAAGGIQGLRPLRYEKRVARNRFIALVLFLLVVLTGLLLVFVHR